MADAPSSTGAAAWTSIGCIEKGASDRGARVAGSGPAMARRLRPSACAPMTDGSCYPIVTEGGDNEEWENVEEPVPIVWAPCNFGGARPWFVCPGIVNGISCRRRVGKLYGSGRYFLCRQCYRLAYQSQREQPHERALRRANNIRMRLGGGPGVLSPFPEKPKGMHWRSYERQRQRAAKAEGAADEHLWMWLGRLKAQRGKQRKAKGFWT